MVRYESYPELLHNPLTILSLLQDKVSRMTSLCYFQIDKVIYTQECRIQVLKTIAIFKFK